MIAIVGTAVVFLILAIGLAICCMKNHSRKTTRVAVLQITEQSHAAARRDERRERRQREAAAAMAAFPQQYMAGYPNVPPPSYNTMYGDAALPGAFGEQHIPPPAAYPPLPNVGAPSEAYGGAPSGAYGGAPSGAYGGAPSGAYGGAPSGAYGGAPSGAYGGATSGTYGGAPSGAYGGAPSGAYGGGGATDGTDPYPTKH
ncbi:chorion protein S36-like [Pecten maximus]|uniref:chorion protein S36-like n=1 Tax=Pecten maximus TaxID=6579 RepID=UPI0014582F8D|nr:chorion protein S36-like [Pecten maximus]